MSKNGFIEYIDQVISLCSIQSYSFYLVDKNDELLRPFINEICRDKLAGLSVEDSAMLTLDAWRTKKAFSRALSPTTEEGSAKSITDT